MKTFRAHLKSVSPIQFSKRLYEPKLEKENPEDYDRRVWKEKAHYNEGGFLIIPANFFSNSLAGAAKYLSIKIEGEGNAKYTKNFLAGVLVVDDLVTKYTRDTISSVLVDCSVDGKRGGTGPRVLKKFPIIPSWEGFVNYIIVDEKITMKIFEKVLISCGQLQGLGSYRPINGGNYGRFEVLDIKEVES